MEKIELCISQDRYEDQMKKSVEKVSASAALVEWELRPSL